MSGQYWHQGSTRRQLTDFANPAVTEGRYHELGGVGCWYASGSAEAAWAELFRHFEDDGVHPMEVKRRFGSVTVTELTVLDLTDRAVLQALGLEEDDLIDDDYSTCQGIARAAFNVGLHGVLGPSAALEGVTTLAVFAPLVTEKINHRVSVVTPPPEGMREVVTRVRRR